MTKKKTGVKKSRKPKAVKLPKELVEALKVIADKGKKE